jgi:hypothetical protein
LWYGLEVIALNEPTKDEKKKMQDEVEDDFDFLEGENGQEAAMPFYMQVGKRCNHMLHSSSYELPTTFFNNQPVNKDKLLDRCKKYSFEKNLINPPRPGKKLLVLDIDYTLFDHHSACEQVTIALLAFLFI